MNEVALIQSEIADLYQQIEDKYKILQGMENYYASYINLDIALKQAIRKVLDCDLMTNSRRQEVVKARQFYYYYMRENTTLSLKAISRKVYNQDHSTVLNALKCFDDRWHFDKGYKQDYELVMQELNEILNQQTDAYNTI